jgi:hypothetical protein
MPMLHEWVWLAIAIAIAVKWLKDIKRAVEAARNNRDGK